MYLALGIQRDGTKEVLGIWIQQSEGAKFWLGIMNELHHRGLKDNPGRSDRRPKGLSVNH